MLVKSEVLERFGLFDPVYSGPGYENDFRCRINRFGYSSLAANRAYVYNHPPSSNEYGIAESEIGQLSLLKERYPELDRAISNYAGFRVDPLEKFATLYSSHRPRILYDLYHLPPQHSGTSDFALNLLREIEPLVRQEWELFVGAGKEQTFFLPELRGYQLHDEAVDSPAVFDLVYKPCQLFGWPEFACMNRLAPRLAFTLQDIIAIRCDYIGRAGLPELFFESVELSDLVFAISDSTRADFAAFYSAEAPMQVIHHGSDARLPTQEAGHGEYLLIMGNAYAHKGVSEAVQELAGRWPLVVLGPDPQSSQPHVRCFPSGKLTRRCIYDLFVGARIVVYPSHYEGFGLPVVDALAMGKPVIVLDTAINRELSRGTADPNLFRVASSKDLPRTVEDLWPRPPRPSGPHPRRWSDVASEYFAAFQTILSNDIDVSKMRRRWRVLRLLASAGLH
jgi:glycosyltransferase involved in cell wall biosynthesis